VTTVETLPLPGDQPTPADAVEPSRNPTLVLAAALDGWTDWQPGNGTAYRAHVARVAGGPDHADRILLINCCGTTLAVQYTDPQIAAYRARRWTRKRWVDTGLHKVGDYDLWDVARPLLTAAGAA
jgi:hypothetical protein